MNTTNHLFTFIKNHYKLLTLALFLLLIGIGIYSFYIQQQRQGEIAFEISVLPRDAKVTFNDSPGKNGVNYLVPGTYEIKITKDGFADYTQTYVIGKQLTGMVTNLTATSEQAKDWVKNNQKAILENEGKQRKYSEQTVAYFSEKNPIISVLPYKDPYFTIGYKSTDTINVTITIYTESPRYRYAALKQIRAFGYDPSDYRIEYTNFKNPLGN